MPYRAVPCRATPHGARPGAAFTTTAVNLRQIEFGKFSSGITKNTRRARSTFLQDCNPVLYHLRHTLLMNISVLNTRFPILVYYTIPYYTILYYTILYYTIRYYTILYCIILYYTVLYYTILYYTILYYTILYLCREGFIFLPCNN